MVGHVFYSNVVGNVFLKECGGKCLFKGMWWEMSRWEMSSKKNVVGDVFLEECGGKCRGGKSPVVGEVCGGNSRVTERSSSTRRVSVRAER